MAENLIALARITLLLVLLWQQQDTCCQRPNPRAETPARCAYGVGRGLPE